MFVQYSFQYLDEYNYVHVLFQETLKLAVETAISTCPNSMFIFDEVDKMPGGVLDVLKSVLDFHRPANSKDYKPSIFIFLRYSFD